MLSLFCVRLSLGLLAALFLLLPFPVHPRFFRTHFLTALGLLVLALVVLAVSGAALTLSWYVLLTGAVLCGLGSTIWLFENAPGRWLFTILASVTTGTALVLLSQQRQPYLEPLTLADDFTSAALLGLVMTAMLLGHSYLIMPSLTITPLLRVVAVLGVSLLLRLALGLFGLWLWTGRPSSNLETETLLWLAARWVLGFLIPLFLTWMAWETTRIRSTQSATGILYVVVIFCFLGELTSLLLYSQTGMPL